MAIHRLRNPEILSNGGNLADQGHSVHELANKKRSGSARLARGRSRPGICGFGGRKCHRQGEHTIEFERRFWKN